MRLNLRLFSLILTVCIVVGAGSAQAGSVKATSAPKVQGSTNSSELPWTAAKWGMNQGIGYLPGPESYGSGTLLGAIIGGSANIIFDAFKVNYQEDRELGHGEACVSGANGASPIPFSDFSKPCANMVAKLALCSDVLAQYYYVIDGTPQRDLVPPFVKVLWYKEKYCSGPIYRQYDPLLRDAGMFRDKTGIHSVWVYRMKGMPIKMAPLVAQVAPKQKAADISKPASQVASVEDVGAEWSAQQMRTGSIIVLSE